MPASGISAPSCSAKKHKKKTPAASGAAGVGVLCRLSSVIPGGNICIGGVLRGRGCRLRGRLRGCRCRLCSRLRGCRCRLCSRFGCGTRRCSRLRCRGHLRFPVSYTHLRAHETDSYLVCRLLLEKKKKHRNDFYSLLKNNYNKIMDMLGVTKKI